MKCKECNNHLLICEFNEFSNYNVYCYSCGYKYEEGETTAHAWENVYKEKVESLERTVKSLEKTIKSMECCGNCSNDMDDGYGLSGCKLKKFTLDDTCEWSPASFVED